MGIWIAVIGIGMALILPLVSVIWTFTNKRISRAEEKAQQTDVKVQKHEVELARGDEKLEIIHEMRDEQKIMHDDILVIKSNCPNCKG